jgi:hypothetical protein
MRINQSISKTSFYSYLHLFTSRWLRQFAYFSFFTSSHRFSELHRFSATFDDPRVPREYLLAVTSGRIAVVRTKVLVSSSLSINRSNRLARFGYRLRVLALCVCRSTFASTETRVNFITIGKDRLWWWRWLQTNNLWSSELDDRNVIHGMKHKG